MSIRENESFNSFKVKNFVKTKILDKRKKSNTNYYLDFLALAKMSKFNMHAKNEIWNEEFYNFHVTTIYGLELGLKNISVQVKYWIFDKCSNKYDIKYKFTFLWTIEPQKMTFEMQQNYDCLRYVQTYIIFSWQMVLVLESLLPFEKHSNTHVYLLILLSCYSSPPHLWGSIIHNNWLKLYLIVFSVLHILLQVYTTQRIQMNRIDQSFSSWLVTRRRTCFFDKVPRNKVRRDLKKFCWKLN